MYEGLKAVFLRPEKYRTPFYDYGYKPEQKKAAREEAEKDAVALLCDGCPFKFGEHGTCKCRHVDKDDHYPDWAGGSNMCLRYAIERLGLRGWIQPSGDPLIITKEAARAIAESLEGEGYL